ncbi:MAG TPA: MOSC domain-containing protein [Rubrivivax sp.]|nr:MOSC domain-containing protein [Burkholderiales bacterium]HNT39362.1 MOSC domain-containing protein [Rubrivivax sp.]
MNASPPRVRAVLFGPTGPLGHVQSGIDKKPVAGPHPVGALGLRGDEQGDTRAHGGVDKAVHVYPWAHYAWWRARYPQQPLFDRPGAFGENLCVDGMDEASVCLGDEWRIGSVRLQLTQGRQPCFRLNLRFGVREMAAQVQDSLRTGWYFRVLEPGLLATGDVPVLLRRPHPDWSVAELMALIRDRVVDPSRLAPVLELPLTPSWRKLFTQRLQGAGVEDWSRRLHGA